MYIVRMQKNDDVSDCVECVAINDLYHEYETKEECKEAVIAAADDYAELWYANVFHDSCGLSTVYFDDGQYSCFQWSEL